LIKGKLTVQSQYLTVIQPFPKRNRFPDGVWLINKTRAHHDNFQTNLHIHINRAATINKILLQLKKNQNSKYSCPCTFRAPTGTPFDTDGAVAGALDDFGPAGSGATAPDDIGLA
jgi:hypothetical protein